MDAQPIIADQIVYAVLLAICVVFVAKQALLLLDLIVHLAARAGVFVLGAVVFYLLARGVGA